MTIHQPIRIASKALICVVWFVNGFYCKILNQVPRHQEIIGQILGEQNSWQFSKTIAIGELLIVAWILSGVKRRWCAVFQMMIVGIMNIIEFLLVPDLLLFGRLNIVFASIFIAVIYINEFVFNKHQVNNQTI